MASATKRVVNDLYTGATTCVQRRLLGRKRLRLRFIIVLKDLTEEMMTTDGVRGFIERLVSRGRLPRSKLNDPEAILRATDASMERFHEFERNDEFEREEALYRLDQAAAIDPFWSYRYH